MFSALLAILGLIFTALGVGGMLAAVMPKFGGGSEPHLFPVGCIFCGVGIGLIFYAGSFL